MASFTNGPTQTQESRDFASRIPSPAVDTSGASAINSANSLLTGIVKAADEDFKRAGEEQARQVVEAVQDEFYNEQRLFEEKKQAVTEAPIGMQEKLTELERLTSAAKRGVMNPVHYWAKMDTAARELRARFPSYKEEIDQNISRLTGAKPANKVIAELMDENQRFKPEGQKLLDHWHELAVKSGNPNYNREFTLAGKRGTVEQAMAAVYEQAALDNKEKMEKHRASMTANELSINKNIREEDKAIKEQQVEDVFVSRINSSFYRIGQSIGMDSPKMQDTIKQINSFREKGQSVPEDLTKQLGTLSGQMKLQLQRERDNVLYTPSSPGAKSIAEAIGNPEKVAQYIKNTDARIDSMVDPLTKGDLSLLDTNMRFAKAATESAGARVMQDRRNADMAAMRKIHADNVMQYFINKNPDLAKTVEGMIVDSLRMSVAAGSNSGTISEDIRNNSLKGSQPKDLVKTTIDNITDPKLPLDIRMKNIAYAFETPNKATQLISGVQAGSARETLWNTMTGDSVIKAMEEIGKTDPRVLQNYKRWINTAGGIHMSSYLNGANEYNSRNTGFTLQYEPGTQSFIIAKEGTVKAGKLPDPDISLLKDKLNTNLKTIKRGFELYGDKSSLPQDIETFVRRSGFMPVDRTEKKTDQ